MQLSSSKFTAFLFGALLLTGFNQSSFALENSQPNQPKGGDVVGTYPSGSNEVIRNSGNPTDLKTRGNSTVAGTEAPNRSVAIPIALGSLLLAGIAYFLLRHKDAPNTHSDRPITHG